MDQLSIASLLFDVRMTVSCHDERKKNTIAITTTEKRSQKSTVNVKKQIIVASLQEICLIQTLVVEQRQWNECSYVIIDK